MAGDRMPTVIVGFDALDFRYLDRFRDRLPNFAALREDGVEAPLASTHPPWTGSAWPSMYTGTDPSHHGVYGFFDYGERYPDDAELVTRDHVDAPALWNYASDRGDSAVVLNVPVTHPADPIEGAVVPGYLAPEESPGHPDGIRDELSDAVGEEYRIYSAHELSDDSDRKLSGYLDLIRLRERAARHLLTEYDWQIAVIQVQKTDAVFHNFDDETAFRKVYEAADRLLGTVRETVDDANVVVCSDHGIGPADGYKIFINDLLREGGFVETTADAAQPTLATEKGSLVGGDATDEAADDEGSPLAERSLTYARTALDAVGLSAGDVYRAAQRVGLGSALKRAVPASVQRDFQEDVDWRASTAYARIGSELGVRINLEGREPAGVVAPDEYERVRTDLIEFLSGVETPDGRPAFDFVTRREEVYDGPHTERAPDVVFAPRGMDHPVLTSLVGTPFVASDAYDHQRTGVFLGAGPAFAPDADVGELSLDDVAPIALAAGGYPVPERMTGSVPPGLLGGSATRRDYGDVAYGSTAGEDGSAVGDGDVEDRLADLGYL